MTQSGQGEPAREGIVLPSDGGEPLLPGMTGGSAPQPAANQPAANQPAAPAAGPPAAAPAGGQSWDRPWGPDQQQTAAPQPGQGWPSAGAQEWAAPGQPAPWTPQEPPAPGAGPLPPEGAPAPSYGGRPHEEPAYGSGAHGAQHQAYGPGGDATQQPYAGGGAPQQQPYAAPLPAPAGDHATQYLPPAAADEGATQFLPPVAAGAPGPAPAPVDEGATQYIPPVAPGALPPETSAEDTRFLGRADQPRPAAPNPDAEATQYIAPVAAPYGAAPGGDRQPPAEFDNLFRGAAAGPGPAPATQQLPPVQQPHDPYPGQPQPAYAPQGPGGGRRGGQDGGGRAGRGGRSRSRVPLIAAAGIGIIVLGVGAGALLSGGGGDDQGDRNKTVAASAPADQESPSPSASADPAEQQAVALDKLLADSGSSRASVIKAVSDVKSCQNLDRAAADLRDAAKQRSELVTRLSRLAVDKLPNHAELTTALTKAWHASASADNHYAAWADQTAGKHGCKKKQARTTGQTQAGNRDSGTASAEKAKAAPLWNAIAKTYGLTQRQPTQL